MFFLTLAHGLDLTQAPTFRLGKDDERVREG